MPNKIDDNQKQTAKYAIGKWFWEGSEKDKSIQMEVIIQKNSLTIQHGIEMTFKISKPIPVSAKWYKDIITFPPTSYFARYADDNTLLFGEFESQQDEIVWEHEFGRIRPWSPGMK